MTLEKILEIYVDGASRGNPGSSAWAYVFVKDNKIIQNGSEYIGRATNNEAEYNAIINALKDAAIITKEKVLIYSDSQLAVKQITGLWKINKSHLAKLCKIVHQRQSKFKTVEFHHVRRTHAFIQICDKLCNACLDKHGF